MKLSGPQYKQLLEALLAAFPDQPALSQMVQFELDANLNAVAGGNNLSNIIFDLIRWAEARGRTKELIRGALNTAPDNPELKAFAASMGVSTSTATGLTGQSDAGQAGGDQVGGDKTTVGNISDASGVAVGQGAQVNITHHHYYDKAKADDQPSTTSD